MDRIGVALRQTYSRRMLLQRFARVVVPAVFLTAACQPAPPAAPESKAPAAAPAAASGQAAATTAPAAPAAAAKPTEAPAAKPADAAKPAAVAPTTAPAAQAGAPADGGTVTLPIQADPTMNPWHPNAFVESIFVNRVLFAGLARPGKDLRRPGPRHQVGGHAGWPGLDVHAAQRRQVERWSAVYRRRRRVHLQRYRWQQRSRGQRAGQLLGRQERRGGEPADGQVQHGAAV